MLVTIKKKSPIWEIHGKNEIRTWNDWFENFHTDGNANNKKGTIGTQKIWRAYKRKDEKTSGWSY